MRRLTITAAAALMALTGGIYAQGAYAQSAGGSNSNGGQGGAAGSTVESQSPPPKMVPAQPGPAGHGAALSKRFDAANTTHDGKLTLAQAQAAGLTAVATNFSAIDKHKRGYVTKREVYAWMRAGHHASMPTMTQ